MRLDKWLKVSRLIKRRTVAQEACDGGRVSVNGRTAKPSVDVKPGDVVEVSDKRGKEILADKRGLASLVEDEVPAEEKKPKKKKTTK